MDFFIGADPEFFLVDENLRLKSSIGVVNGTKHEQLMVDGGGLQRDNVAVEFSCEPTSSEDAFVGIIGKMLRQLSNEVKPYRLSAVAGADFPQDQLDNPEAQMFGCDPDFDAWEMRVNEVDQSNIAKPFRSCGGHIHIGTKDGFPTTLTNDTDGLGRIRIVKAMDLYVGISSIVLDTDPIAPKRRTLYGKAGAHRPKPYGVEYRTVGNFWTRSPDATRLIYRLTSLALKASDTGVAEKAIAEIGEGTIQNIINNSLVDDAKSIVEKYVYPYLKPQTKALFEQAIVSDNNINYAWEL